MLVSKMLEINWFYCYFCIWVFTFLMCLSTAGQQNIEDQLVLCYFWRWGLNMLMCSSNAGLKNVENQLVLFLFLDIGG